eukprot:767530-Hanusia_phi.AAC.2
MMTLYSFEDIVAGTILSFSPWRKSTGDETFLMNFTCPKSSLTRLEAGKNRRVPAGTCASACFSRVV